MNSRILAQTIFVIVLLCTTACLKAQVTIGSGNTPNAGALLDLKQQPDGSSTKGLVLPRVVLTDPDNLFPMFTNNGSGGYNEGTKATEDAKHAGLWVYNTGYDGDMCPGPYLWSGSNWIQLLNVVCPYIAINPEVLNFKKGAPNPKEITLDVHPSTLRHSFSVSGAISSADWNVFPANNNTNTVLQFQPKVNNSGNARSSTITVTSTDGPIVRSKTFVVNQSNDDLLFTPTAATASATGGSQTITVNSQADWKILTKTDASNIITAFDNSTHNSGTSTYSYTIGGNPTFANRTATLHVTSDNIDFVSQNITITQGFVNPYLAVTNGSTIDFGTTNTATAQNVVFDTNAPYTVTYDANYEKVSTTAKLTGTQNTGASALNTLSKTTGFVPVTGTNRYVGHGVAGSVISSTLTFKTTVQPYQTQTTTIKRTVPAAFESVTTTPANNSTIGPKSQTITVKAKSNAAWWAKSDDQGSQSVAAGAYAERSKGVTINIHNSWNNRLVKVYTSTNNSTWTQAGQFTQQGYILNLRSPATSISGTIPIEGATYHVKVNSSNKHAPAFKTKVTYEDGRTEQTFGNYNIDANGNCDANFTVKANNAGSSYINVYFQRTGYGGSGEWVHAGRFLQQGYIDLGTHWGHPYPIVQNDVKTWGWMADNECKSKYGTGWIVTPNAALELKWQNAGYPWSLYGNAKIVESGITKVVFYQQYPSPSGKTWEFKYAITGIMPTSFNANWRCVKPK